METEPDDFTPEEGFTSLFNGKDFTGWKIPAGDNGHWKVIDGVIDYDAESEAPGSDKSLWSERADVQLYRAKTSGRNLVCLEPAAVSVVSAEEKGMLFATSQFTDNE